MLPFTGHSPQGVFGEQSRAEVTENLRTET